MTLKSYLWGIRISALASFGAWVLVVKQVDPEKSGITGILLFYASTFLFLAGLLILFFTWIRRKTGRDDKIAFAYLGVSFRQGILLSLLSIALLVLQQYKMLTWWDGALVIAGVFLVELYFLTRK